MGRGDDGINDFTRETCGINGQSGVYRRFQRETSFYMGRSLNEVARCKAARLGCETVHKNALT